jgi:hypothetical protein
MRHGGMSKRYKSVQVKVGSLLKLAAFNTTSYLASDLEAEIKERTVNPISAAIFFPKLVVTTCVWDGRDDIPDELYSRRDSQYVGMRMYNLPRRSNGWLMESLEYSDSNCNLLWFILAVHVRKRVEKIISLVEESARDTR